MKKLDLNKIPLQGRHIIEASAGTGKTFSITELYIRLLLERRLLPSQILVMTFTKDATQEIIGRVEDKIRSVLEDVSQGKNVQVSIQGEIAEIRKGDENYKHLKRSLLETDEAAIFTIHGFCKKILSEQAFASGIEMDVSMEVDSSSLLQKVVENFFRKNINKNPTNFEYLKIYKIHTPNEFLSKLKNIIKSNYEIIIKQSISLENFIELKKQQLEKLTSNPKIVDKFLDKEGKGDPEDKIQKEYDSVFKWLQKEDNTLFPDNISIITDGRKIRAKEVKNVFEGIRELRDFQQEINLSDAANFIKQACLTIRQDFLQAKEQSGILDFDDLITKLNQSVKRSPELVNALQKQYPVALIDEFQDTDDEQFQILDCIYPKDNKDLLLLMIGDPKQAIYRFRGGDIFTYLKAKDSCSSDNIWSMDTNWRSTKDIIKAYNRLFFQTDYSLEEEGKIKDNAFSQGIGYQLVKASPNADNKAKNFNDELKAINYFYYQREDSDNKGDIDKKLSLWTANEIVRLLNSNTVVESDIAILVENSTQAKVMQQALKSKNLSSVYLSQRDNVYHSQEAKEILAIMEGINDLENKYLLKKALATSLLGSTASKFYSYLDENDILTWDQEIEKAKYLRQLWVSYGFMAFIMHIIHNYFVPRTDFKERVITNILHLAELIKMAENKYKHPNQLIKWYRQQLNSSDISENETRLENDDNLIKIITIHSSKGLEYSVVFIPFASYVSRNKFSVGSFFKYYNVNLQKTVYQIDNNKDIKDQVKNEVLEELLRLFYVAVTRAEHRCYIGVARYNSSENSPLAKFLGYQKGHDWLDKIKNITNNPNNQSLLLDVNDMQEFNLQISNSNTHIDYNSLKANDINLNSDHWSLLSFSKISKSYIKDVALEKENDESDDEDVDLQRTCKDFRFRALRGADMGNLLHNILENTNFSSGKIDDSILQEQVDKYHIVAAEDLHNLKAWLEDCLVAPIPYIEVNYSKEDKSNLSNKDKSFCLKDIPNEKTLREVEFYFPVKNENLLKQDIIDILVEYRTPLNCNAKNIYIADNNKLFGMLHGFIDLIFEYGGKFYVADYKSNYLGDRCDDYNQEKMQDKNQSSLYDLQYLIYSVALDKYLKQHISSYNYEQHFGGVYYFYLRGMKDGFGVYKSRPPLKIINKLASLFSGD